MSLKNGKITKNKPKFMNWLTSWVDDGKISRINGLIDEYEKNEDKYRINQESSLPLAERIFKDEKSLKLLSNEKFNLLQNIFYVKELG